MKQTLYISIFSLNLLLLGQNWKKKYSMDGRYCNKKKVANFTNQLKQLLLEKL